jgi:flagellar basal-body rod protein FlgF
MDHLIYTAMSGASRALTAQQIHANNLANVNTVGFRADLDQVTAHHVTGGGFDTRYLVAQQVSGTLFSQGALQQTGRHLDVAIVGEGFIAVRNDNGAEAYSRAGSLQIDLDGRLMLQGRLVTDGTEAITIPEYRDISISSDGLVNIVPAGGGAVQTVGQIKLVNPNVEDIDKKADGLFYSAFAAPIAASQDVVLQSETLEGSNVSSVTEMVASMSVSRIFEMQVKMMSAAEDMATSGNKLIGGS